MSINQRFLFKLYGTLFTGFLMASCSQDYALNPLKKESATKAPNPEANGEPSNPDGGGFVGLPVDSSKPPANGGSGDGGPNVSDDPGNIQKDPEYVEKDHIETFSIKPLDKKIDILFVVDNSGSMSNEQNILASSFSNFISNFQSRLLSFRIGVITTDTVATSLSGFKTGGPGSLVSYGTNDRILTNSSQNLTTQFTQNVKVGTAGNGGEMGILAATLALSPQNTDPGKWNEQFLRSDAFLSVLFISDEDESLKANYQDYIRNHPAEKQARFDAFKAALERVKPNQLGLVRTDAIVKPKGSTCTTASAEGITYSELVALYKGKTTSICEDFSSKLNSLGEEIATQVQSSVVLTNKPELIEKVTLNGKVLGENTEYLYNKESNAISIIGTALSMLENSASSTIEVHLVTKELVTE